jgi:hypothetical protein
MFALGETGESGFPFASKIVTCPAAKRINLMALASVVLALIAPPARNKFITRPPLESYPASMWTVFIAGVAVYVLVDVPVAELYIGSGRVRVAVLWIVKSAVTYVSLLLIPEFWYRADCPSLLHS